MSEQATNHPIALGAEQLQALQEQAGMEIVPTATTFDFSDTRRFQRLDVTREVTGSLSILTQQLPTALAANTLAQAYIVRFPAGLPHTLTALKQGGFGSMVKGANGRFAGHASFIPVGAQATLLQVFSAMSLATGQYFLTQINSQLKMMNLKLDKILEFLYGDKKAELMAEMHFVQYAYQNFASIMGHEIQATATIASLQQAIKVAVKDIEFYIADLISSTGKKGLMDNADSMAREALRIKESLELSMQLYVMGSILELYYAQNFDAGYVKNLQDTVSAYLNKCERRIGNCFSMLKQVLESSKLPKIRGGTSGDLAAKMDEIIEENSGGQDTPLRATFKSALEAIGKKMEYYLTPDGELYAKVS